MDKNRKIHPVIFSVPENERNFKGRDKVLRLAYYARQALEYSARYSGITLGTLQKEENGAPIPCNGIHWSLTHKSDYVAAVCAPFAIGIDIEKIGPYKSAVARRIADEAEWDLADEMTEPVFFRYWTAKEAVLKAVGKGLTGLSLCRIQSLVDKNHMMVTFSDAMWTVTQYWGTTDHIVAIAANDVDIHWHQL